jgi:hypothetical protein
MRIAPRYTPYATQDGVVRRRKSELSSRRAMTTAPKKRKWIVPSQIVARRYAKRLNRLGIILVAILERRNVREERRNNQNT